MEKKRIFEDYLVMPEKGRWFLLHNIANHEMAYASECSWYNHNTRIAVKNCRTGETKIFIREANPGGKKIELKGDGTL